MRAAGRNGGTRRLGKISGRLNRAAAAENRLNCGRNSEDASRNNNSADENKAQTVARPTPEMQEMPAMDIHEIPPARQSEIRNTFSFNSNFLQNQYIQNCMCCQVR